MPTESITLSATATATYACVNGGGKHPKATNKASATGQVSNTGSFPVRNGSPTGTIAVGPPPAPAFSPPCNPPMTVVLAQVSYTNVTLTGLAGDTSTEPSLSACLFPGIGICQRPGHSMRRGGNLPPLLHAGDGWQPYSTRIQQPHFRAYS